jgi:hypothetical protein
MVKWNFGLTVRSLDLKLNSFSLFPKEQRKISNTSNTLIDNPTIPKTTTIYGVNIIDGIGLIFEVPRRLWF